MKFIRLIVAIIILSSFLLISANLSIDDIPRVPDTILKHSENLGKEKLIVEYWKFIPESISFQEISSQGREEARKCLEVMKLSGWKLKKENRQRRGAEFHFKKEILKEVKVTIAPGARSLKGKKKNYIFFRFEIKRLIPMTDVLGYDYFDVPRFPKSIRIRWMELLGNYSAKYLVIDSIEEVEKYFTEILPKHNWKPGKGAGKLNYIKSGSSQNTKNISQEDIKDPIKLSKKLIPATLSIHLKANEGIIEIGIGRSACSGDPKVKPKLSITSKKKQVAGKKGPLTFINYKKEIPIYPGLKEKFSQTQPINIKGEEIIQLNMEIKKADPKTALDIANFYLSKMKQNNWVLKDEEWHGLGRKLHFVQGAVQSLINIRAIGRYPVPPKASKIKIPVEIRIILPIPTKDIAGKDIAGVPRFPGSIRFYYLEVATDHTVKYKVAASQEEVEWFYIHELAKHKWIFSGYDSTGLLFVPESTAKSPSDALAKGKLIPTTLKLKVNDQRNGVVKIGFTRTRGD